MDVENLSVDVERRVKIRTDKYQANDVKVTFTVN